MWYVWGLGMQFFEEVKYLKSLRHRYGQTNGRTLFNQKSSAELIIAKTQNVWLPIVFFIYMTGDPLYIFFMYLDKGSQDMNKIYHFCFYTPELP